MTARAFALRLSFALSIGFAAAPTHADLASALSRCESAGLDESVFSISVCPGLADAIESSHWGELLAPKWREDLSYPEVRQLVSLDTHYRQSNHSNAEISMSSLDAIVAGLNAPAASQPVSLWDRLMSWIRGLLTKEAGNGDNWLAEWLSDFQVSELTTRVIFWSLAALIIIAAIVVVIIEIRAARTSRMPGAKRRKNRRGRDELHPVAGALSLKDLDAAPAHEKPSILLRLLSQRLERSRLATYRPALTHRELSLTVSGLHENERETLFEVAESAERVRFASSKPLPEEISRVVSAGLALLGTLDAGQA